MSSHLPPFRKSCIRACPIIVFHPSKFRPPPPPGWLAIYGPVTHAYLNIHATCGICRPIGLYNTY